MASVINTNIAATRTHNVYNRNNEFMNAAMTRVATGMKINSAKDGASTWAISEKMRERIRANDQANQNVQNDTAMLKVAQGGIGNTIDILKTLKERAINGLNDSNINSDRSNIATEVYQLVSQIDDNAAKVKFNGRVLLNGDSDQTVGKLDVDEASATEKTAALVEPTVATNPTAKGSNAVYGFSIADLKDKDGAAVTTSTKLVDMVDSEGNALFKESDKIQFTWKENDTANQKTYEVNSATTFGDLATKLTTDVDNFAYIANFAAGNDITFSSVATDKVTDSGSQDLKAKDAGIYLVGKSEVAITDLAVAVTYEDAENDNALTTRVAAQEALAFTGVQQATAPDSGSNAVYNIAGVFTDNNGGTSRDVEDASLLHELKIDGNYLFSSDHAVGNTYTVTIGEGDDAKKITGLTGSTTWQQFKAKLATEGITVQIAAANKELKDGEGNNVTKNTLDGSEKLKATAAGMYFIGKSGEELGKINIKATKDGSAAMAVNGAPAADGYDLSRVQVAKASDSDTDTTETATAASTNVTFHIGGEDGFNMNVSIKAMNMNTLFGTDEKKFAKMFLSTDDLKKGDGTNSVVAMIDKAISTALNEQTKLGAIESRLGYTSDNLTTMNENLEAADSVMRDSDIAKEMTSYMKYAVLSQASQYMLAQAGQNAFQVLNLLQQ